MKWILLAGLGVLRGLAVAFIAGGLWAYAGDGEGAWLFFAGVVLLILVRLIGVPWRGIAGGVLAGSALAGLGLGYVVHDVLQDERLEQVWSVAADSPNTLEPKGHWSLPDTLVRVRSDGAFAYGLRDGAPRWTHELPRPQTVCAASRAADGGVGLLVYTVDDETCDRVVALDLATGQAVWARRVQGARVFPAGGQGEVEAGSGVAVVPAASGLKIFDLRTGAPRRALRTPAGCSFEPGVSSIAVGAGRAAATYVCADGSGRLGVVEIAGGGRWKAGLGSGGRFEDLAVLSADPPVVRVEDSSGRGRKELLVFDPASGERTSAVPADTLDPAFPVLIGGGRIHTVVNKPGTAIYQNDLVSHPLSRGRPWSVHFEHGIKAVSLVGSTLFTLTEPGISDQVELTSLDPGTGARTRGVKIDYAAPSLWRPDLLVASDRVLFLLRDPSNETDAEVLAFDAGQG